MSIPRTHPARFQPKIHPGLKLEDDPTEKEQKSSLHQSGKIAADVRKYIAKNIKPGASILDLCTKADDLIRKVDALPAFPINISVNENAAHYTSPPTDALLIPDSGIVKIDVGAHINGFIADTAESVDIDGSFKELVKATVDATETAIKVIRPGTKTGDLGGVIEKVIRRYNFEPIRELSGHLVGRYVVHGGKSIPNVGGFTGETVELGETYAIETFASNGQGSVHADLNKITIYRASPLRVKVRSPAARKVLKAAIHEFGGMPFAERWLEKTGLSKAHARSGLRELQKVGGIIEYHVLREANPEAIVSQHEHTMVITEDGAEVTTRLK
ncbi:MAG: type II methionyl aminopeptidase [Candidatus Kariarchaeaceae archaeon]|jgi:methionyl aminopeptidase